MLRAWYTSENVCNDIELKKPSVIVWKRRLLVLEWQERQENGVQWDLYVGKEGGTEREKTHPAVHL